MVVEVTPKEVRPRTSQGITVDQHFKDPFEASTLVHPGSLSHSLPDLYGCS
jgi:hypothetical protein